VLNLSNITFIQRQQRSDAEVLRNAQRFIPANRCRKTQEKTFGSGLGVYDKRFLRNGYKHP